MLTNGRSIHRIQTSDETRRNRWLHLFSTDALPIIGTAPRWQEQQGRGFPVLAYDLALAELSHAQRARFAGYLSRKYDLAYTAVLAELETAVSWPIKASFDIQVLEPAEQAPSLASLLPGLQRLWKRPFIRLGFG